MLSNWKRIIRSGFINFWRSGVVSLSSVIILTVTLFTIGGLILAQAFLTASLDEIKAKVDISVSFQPDATEEEILAFKRELTALPEVRSVVYRSREEEYDDFKQRNQKRQIVRDDFAFRSVQFFLHFSGNPLFHVPVRGRSA